MTSSVKYCAAVSSKSRAVLSNALSMSNSPTYKSPPLTRAFAWPLWMAYGMYTGCLPTRKPSTSGGRLSSEANSVELLRCLHTFPDCSGKAGGPWNTRRAWRGGGAAQLLGASPSPPIRRRRRRHKRGHPHTVGLGPRRRMRQRLGGGGAGPLATAASEVPEAGGGGHTARARRTPQQLRRPPTTKRPRRRRLRWPDRKPRGELQPQRRLRSAHRRSTPSDCASATQTNQDARRERPLRGRRSRRTCTS